VIDVRAPEIKLVWDAFSFQYVGKILAAFGRFVIEVDDGGEWRRAGTMGFKRVNERSRIAHLERLAVHPDFRGRRLADVRESWVLAPNAVGEAPPAKTAPVAPAKPAHPATAKDEPVALTPASKEAQR